ncbi:L,D-transpeptidase family protein [Peptococcaceae bacterium 1198_IL3148]
MGLRTANKKLCLLFILSLIILIVGINNHSFTVITKTEAGSLEGEIKFILPIKLEKSSTHLYPEYPQHAPQWSVEQTKANVVTIKVQEHVPYGQNLKLKLGYRPLGLPITFHIQQDIVNDVIPKLMDPKNKVVSSDKPLIFQFNTFIDPKSMTAGTSTSIPGYFKPTDWDGVKNYSRWQFTPEHPLAENHSFSVIFKPSIYSTNNKYLEKQIICQLITGVKPQYVSGSVIDNANNISLYPKLEFTYNQKLAKANIILKETHSNCNVSGQITVTDHTASFIPDNVLLPNTKYFLTIKVESIEQQASNELQINFTTEEVASKYWVDVKLGAIHTVTIYQGQYPIRFMLASGGRSGHETPLGKYYIQDRGSSFWAARFGEGANYWVRIVGSILIHSVPKDANWQTKEEEHAKLGLPASHGCIRLAEPDAKWVYENLPANTMVIIHN